MSLASPSSLALWCFGAFLCGSIPFGLLLVKLAGKGDVRAHGSGNIGATNVSRVGGKGLGIVTLLLDILKGFLPVFIAKKVGLGENSLAVLALVAVLGHVFTPWLKFQGGKGVATALGVIIAFEPQLMILPMSTFILGLWLTRHVSLGSILAAAMVPLQFLMIAFTLFGPPDWRMVFPLVILAILVIWKHRENIQRLQEGSESKLWGDKKEAARG